MLDEKLHETRKTKAPERKAPSPVAGPIFKRAAALPVEGAKRRKLLCLLAAYADAGETSPAMVELARRLELDPVVVDHLLDALVRDGLLKVEWAGKGRPGARASAGRRNVYALVLEARS